MQLYSLPFSRAYWKDAAKSLRDTKMLALAALVVALRVALRSVNIPIGDNLIISVGFLPNALGALVYGPVVALLSGAVSDILGATLFPMGPFFPLFTVVEMLGALLFALFFYRTRITVPRVALARLSVNVLCNIILTPICLSLMYGKGVFVYVIPRIAKNLLLFPLESVLLCVLFQAMMPVLCRAGLASPEQAPPALEKRHIGLFIGLLIAAGAAVFLFYWKFAK